MKLLLLMAHVLVLQQLLLQLVGLFEVLVRLVALTCTQAVMLLREVAQPGVCHQQLILQVLDDAILLLDELLVEDNFAFKLQDAVLEFLGGFGKFLGFLLLLLDVTEGGFDFADHLEFGSLEVLDPVGQFLYVTAVGCPDPFVVRDAAP